MSEEGLICSIDLQFTSEFEGEDWFVVTVCGHPFHNSCLEQWFNRGKSNCPMCNAEIRDAGLTRMHGINPSKRRPSRSQSQSSNESQEFVEVDVNGEETPTLEDLGKSTEVPDYNFKIVLLGASGVGKSCLIRRYATGIFPYNVTATIGTDVAFRTFAVGGKVIKLTIWDTSGQEKFKSISQNFARNAHGALLVYSYDNAESAQEIPYWLDFLKTCGCSDGEAAMLLVGNKADFKDKQLTSEAGRDLARQTQMDFFETSAKDGLNVESVFRALAVETLQKIENGELKYIRPRGRVLEEITEEEEEPKRNCCC